MQGVTTVGLDIAKSVFQVHGIDAAGQVVIRRQLKRRYVLAFFEKLPPCLVGIEACASSHHWSRELKALGPEYLVLVVDEGGSARVVIGDESAMTVRTAILMPIAWALVQALGLPLPGRGSALIILSTFEMAVLPGMEEELSKEMGRSLKKQKVEVHLKTKATGFKKGKNGLEVTAEVDGKPQTFECDVVLSCVVRRPNGKGLGLEVGHWRRRDRRRRHRGSALHREAHQREHR